MRKEVDCVLTVGKLTHNIHDRLQENPDITILRLSDYASENLVQLISSIVQSLKNASDGLRD